MNRYLGFAIGFAALSAMGCGGKAPVSQTAAPEPAPSKPGIKLLESTSATRPPETVVFTHDSQTVLMGLHSDPKDVLHSGKLRYLIGTIGSKDAIGDWYEREYWVGGFTADRKHVVFLGIGIIEVRKVETGELVRTVKTAPNNEKPVVACSADGSRMAVVKENLNEKGQPNGLRSVHVWDTATWELVGRCGEDMFESPIAIAFTADPSVVATLEVPAVKPWEKPDIESEGKLTTWSVKTGNAMTTTKIAMGQVKRDGSRVLPLYAVLARDGKTVAWVTANSAVWTASDGPPKALAEGVITDWILGISADGKTVMTKGAKREADPSVPLKELHIRTWDRTTGEMRQELVIDQDPFAWVSPDLRHLILWYGSYRTRNNDLKDKLLLYSVPE